MHGFYILSVFIITALILLFIEYRVHLKRLESIPIRVHINGTRGKSSVTRLIGAGLRAGGLKCITKVTGTFPRLILEDGTETKIYRKASANILEQLAIVKYAAEHKAQAIVIECMALQPQYQHVTENMMIRSTVGIMTNVRLDHVEIMGHTLPEIARTMGGTIPKKKILFTSEDTVKDDIINISRRRKTTPYFVSRDGVTKEEMDGFNYIEHPENVSLALAVCSHLGIDRQTALNGMYNATPDAGVLKKFVVDVFGKKMHFYNAFAANDPDSTFMIWEKIRNEMGLNGIRIILLNTRQDRLDRAKQLSELTAKKLAAYTDFVMLTGESCEMVENMLIRDHMPAGKIINLGWTTPEKVFEEILSVTKHDSTIIAIGNMGGIGADIVRYFENRSQQL